MISDRFFFEPVISRDHRGLLVSRVLYLGYSLYKFRPKKAKHKTSPKLKFRCFLCIVLNSYVTKLEKFLSSVHILKFLNEFLSLSFHFMFFVDRLQSGFQSCFKSYVSPNQSEITWFVNLAANDIKMNCHF